MHRYLAALLILCSSHAFAAANYKLAMGLGVESRLDNEVNPGYTDGRVAGQIFQELHFQPWTLAVELGYEQHSSSSGSYSIGKSTASLAAWGRYSFKQEDRWSPFIAAGLGGYFDKVTSTLDADRDVRRGRRIMVGAGAGITNLYWKYLLLEAEGRIAGVEQRRDPAFSLIFRAGVQI
jgi:hypothetical protein